jgi:hypothetical protein
VLWVHGPTDEAASSLRSRADLHLAGLRQQGAAGADGRTSPATEGEADGAVGDAGEGGGAAEHGGAIG